MIPKKSTFIGTALLTSVLAFPGCDLAKPMNKQSAADDVADDVIVIKAPPEPVEEPAPEIKPPVAIAKTNIPIKPPTALPKITAQPRTMPPRMQRPERLSAPQRFRQPAQLPPGWTPEKFATVEQLKDEADKRWSSIKVRCPGQSEFDDIDPRGVGRNVVFSHRWLEYVGQGKPLTEQQFEQLINRIDKVYDAYAEFTGRTPHSGEKIFIDFQSTVFTTTSKGQAGHAHSTSNMICINSSSRHIKERLQEIVLHNSSDHVLMHEVAHLFSDQMAWAIDSESIVELLISYAMETNRELHYDGISPNTRTVGRKIVGDQHRLRLYQQSLAKLRTNKIDTFKEVYDLYLSSLPNVVGWDVIKNTIQSYNDKNFSEPFEYQAENIKITKGCRFFDRIKHFSGNPDILQKFPPDKGALLHQKLYAVAKQQTSEKTTEPIRQTKLAQSTLEK